jgi:hypothetical protein
MTQTNYYEYRAWAQEQAADLPGMSYDSDTARFVVNGTKPFPTYLQAKWYYDYIYKFGGNPLGVKGFLPGFGADLKNSTFIVGSVKADSFADMFTHAATTNATMVDSDGLLKWRPHNLLTYSEQFDNAAWTKSGVTAGADLITEDTSTGNHRILPVAGISVPAVLHTNAIEVKPNGRTRVRLTNNNLAGSTFDLVGSGSVVSGSGTITSLEDGWYRISSELVSPTTERLILYLDDGTGTSYTGDGVSGVYIRKAHLYRSDLGGMVNNPDRGDSYVPTTSSAVYLPRRNHHVWNGSAWVNEGLLHESEARTNLVTYSEPDTSGFASVRSSLSTSAVASPDGGFAQKLVEDNSAGLSHYLGTSTLGMSLNTTYTMSWFAKAAERSFIAVNIYSGTTSYWTWFDLSNGTVGTATNSPTTFIQDYGNGWYRCGITVTTAASGTPNTATYISSGDGVLNYDGDGSSGIYIYGAQLEAGSTPSSHIPSDGSTATRAAETLTIPAANLPWPSPRVIGDELVTNGTFDTDSDWTKGTGWTIAAGVATQSGGNTTLQQSGILVTGALYVVTFTVAAISAGSVRVYLGGNYGTYRNATGTFSETIVCGGTGTFFIQGNPSFVGSIDNVSVREIDPLAVSIQMEGLVTYADTGDNDEVDFIRWSADSSNRILHFLQTTSTDVGQVIFRQDVSGIQDFVESATDTYSPGILVPFNIASRHGSTFINGAVDGTALTADTTPVALPDLSATDLDLGYDFMGTIKTFRIWAADIGDTGIAEASS